MTDNELASVPPQMPPTEGAATLQGLEDKRTSSSASGEAATDNLLDVDLDSPTPAVASTTSITEELRQLSLSPVPAASSPIQPPATSTSPRPATDVSLNPRIAALRAMFPDYDDLILQSVLESVNGSQDAAIDALLGMSDPEYTSDTRHQEPVLTQTDLDEQLARRLMLEEQEAQQQQWAAQPPQPATPQRRNTRPYEVYQQQYHQQGALPPAGERDTMAEFQEQINKIAETGKKTFGNIFSKVKAKIQEYDQGRPVQSSSGGYNPNQQQQQPYYGQAEPTATQSRPQQPAYYDPNPPMSPPTSSITPPAAAIHGYDVTPPPATTFAPPSGSPPPASTSRGSNDVPRPPQTGTGMPIDAGKLGLLPKRPVSLLPDPAAAPAHVQQPTDDDDGLEYVENPFEDPRK